MKFRQTRLGKKNPPFGSYNQGRNSWSPRCSRVSGEPKSTLSPEGHKEAGALTTCWPRGHEHTTLGSDGVQVVISFCNYSHSRGSQDVYASLPHARTLNNELRHKGFPPTETRRARAVRPKGSATWVHGTWGRSPCPQSSGQAPPRGANELSGCGPHPSALPRNRAQGPDGPQEAGLRGRGQPLSDWPAGHPQGPSPLWC